MEPNVDVVEGYRAAMPSYLGVIDPAETAALVAYIRSLRDGGPSSGVILPPMELKPAEITGDGGT